MDTLLKLSEVEQIVRLHRSTIYRLMRQGRFPLPLKLSRAVRWRRSELEQWLEERPRATGDHQAAIKAA